jgi:hypothetical protein
MQRPMLLLFSILILSFFSCNFDKRKASTEGKYWDLQKSISVPLDEETYGSFHELGFYTVSNYKEHTKLPIGYWVYVAPNWFIWKKSSTPISDVLSEEEYSSSCPNSIVNRGSKTYRLRYKNGSDLNLDIKIIGVSLWLNFPADKAIELSFGQCIRAKIEEQSEKMVLLTFVGDRESLPWTSLGMNRILEETGLEIVQAVPPIPKQ